MNEALSDKLGTVVSIGGIDLGFFNRIIIDDVYIQDKSGDKLLKASRLAAKVDILSAMQGNIYISSLQLFGLEANAYRDVAKGQYNFQFVLDSLQSKDTTKKSNLDLQINSIILRNSALSFRQQKEHTHRNGSISTNDIEIQNLSTHIILNKLTNDSISVKLKRLSFKELSGLEVKDLAFKLNGSKKGATLSDFRFELPGTIMKSSELAATYSIEAGKPFLPTLQYEGDIQFMPLSIADFSPIINSLKNVKEKFAFQTTFSGSGSYLRFKSITLKSSTEDFTLLADGAITDPFNNLKWNLNINNLHVVSSFAEAICKELNVQYPSFLNKETPLRLDFKGIAGGYKQDVSLHGTANTNAGNVNISLGKRGKNLSTQIATTDFNIATLTGKEDFGLISAKLNAEGFLPDKISANGTISKIEYKSHTYNNIALNAAVNSKLITGNIAIDDAMGNIAVNGEYNHSTDIPSIRVNASVKDFQPYALGLMKKHADIKTSMQIMADITGNNLNNIAGNIDITDISIFTDEELFTPKDINILSDFHGKSRHLSIDSDICQLDINGQFDYSSIVSSFTNIVAKHIHTLPGTSLTYKKRDTNNFQMRASVTDTRLIEKFLGVGFHLESPMDIVGTLNDSHDYIDAQITALAFTFNDAPYKDASIKVKTEGESLQGTVSIKKNMDNGNTYTYNINADANNDVLSTVLRLNDDNPDKRPISGSLSTRTNFFRNADGMSAAHINIEPSTISIGDTVWNVHRSSAEYWKNNLSFNNFSVSHGNQFLTINGKATDSPNDSLTVHLNDIDISYILGLVNFHAVEFSGMATGTACVASLFAKQPKAGANLTVRDFKFENGQMGTLHANASLNNDLKQIDISATADDDDDRHTIIDGYVSPQRGDINLNITAQRTRLKFIESFCSSFMQDVEAEADGSVRLYGPLKNINLTGHLVANGQMHITSLNTTYYLHNGNVRFIPDAIIMENDTIHDRNGNIGIVNGTLGHQHLTRLTYDIDIKAENLLSYDTHTFGDDTFYGTAYVTGDCKINGRSGEVVITVNGTPQKGSVLVYDVASPDALASQEFLQWTSKGNASDQTDSINIHRHDDNDLDVTSDIRLNLLINTTPEATIRLIMDHESGDYITLNGSGVLKASYYNKGSFDLFGNYLIETGHYRLTVQNFIKRDFLFKQGGTIKFGGDPYAALLNLNAVYTINSVSLADLNIGRSFTSNNTRVDCIMNITGTPSSPQVDFSLDVPTISSDARQMIYSLMNSEEEMNQQVLYLLAVGRFMSQGQNNAGVESVSQQNQASLAMQSILSGTIMQQVNDVIGNLTSNSDWNFGANISTGTEGFNNAEYEGLLSGKLLSGRLLVDGQFGYRDNANATTSFIGDFDLKYLLYPNGNLAINFYNKTNDRYFTRNSLTTQGIGLLMKRDFTTIWDLLGIKKRKKSAASNTSDNSKK